MYFRNLSKLVTPGRPIAYTAAGQTDLTGTAINTLGYTGVLIVAALGTVSAGGKPQLKAQGSSDDGSTDAYADLAGTLITGDTTSTFLVLDLHKPQTQYVKPILLRSGGTGNIVVENVVAYLYNADLVPAATITGESVKAVNTPGKGTA